MTSTLFDERGRVLVLNEYRPMCCAERPCRCKRKGELTLEEGIARLSPAAQEKVRNQLAVANTATQGFSLESGRSFRVGPNGMWETRGGLSAPVNNSERRGSKAMKKPNPIIAARAAVMASENTGHPEAARLARLALEHAKQGKHGLARVAALKAAKLHGDIATQALDNANIDGWAGHRDAANAHKVSARHSGNAIDFSAPAQPYGVPNKPGDDGRDLVTPIRQSTLGSMSVDDKDWGFGPPGTRDVLGPKYRVTNSSTLGGLPGIEEMVLTSPPTINTKSNDKSEWYGLSDSLKGDGDYADEDRGYSEEDEDEADFEGHSFDESPGEGRPEEEGENTTDDLYRHEGQVDEPLGPGEQPDDYAVVERAKKRRAGLIDNRRVDPPVLNFKVSNKGAEYRAKIKKKRPSK